MADEQAQQVARATQAAEVKRLARDEREVDLVLTDTQNWASRSHRELYEAVHNNNDPGQTGEIGAEWGQFGTELTEAARLINERVAVSESGWTGDAADAARLAIKGLADWVTHTAETAVEVGKRVQDESQIMQNARASMPAPVEFNWDQATGAFTAGGISGLASSAADVQAANDQARALHEHAITVMSTMERESQAVDQTTPQFSAPFNPVTGRTEEPQLSALRAVSAPTLSDAAMPSSGGGGGAATAASAYAPTAPTQPYQQAAASQPAQGYQPSGTTNASYAAPAAASYQPPTTTAGAGGGYGGPSVAPAVQPLSPATAYRRPEGTTAAAAAAQVPVANPYTPPSSTNYTGGGGYNPPGGGYNQPGGSGYVPPYQPANPNTVPRQGGGTLPPGVKPPAYIPAGSPGTPPLPGTPGGGPGIPGGGGGGGGGRMPGGMPGGMPPGGFGGGAGGFGPTGSGGAGGGGGSLAAGGSTGAVGGPGPRGAMPGGFGPGGAGAAGSPMAGGAPMGGAPAGGQQGEDKEHRAAGYIRGEDIFEVPGENLPPSVIGGAKQPRKKGDPS